MPTYIFAVLSPQSTDAAAVEKTARKLEAAILKVVNHDAEMVLYIAAGHASTSMVGDALADRLKIQVYAGSKSVLGNQLEAPDDADNASDAGPPDISEPEAYLFVVDDHKQLLTSTLAGFAVLASAVDLEKSPIRSIAEIGPPRKFRAGDVFTCDSKGRWTCLAEEK